MMAIIAGLNLQSVNFFVRSLSQKHLQPLLEIESLMNPSGNFRTYRAEVRQNTTFEISLKFRRWPSYVTWSTITLTQIIISMS